MSPATYPDTLLLIDNEWCAAASGKTLEVLNTATGLPIGNVAHAVTTDLDRALAAAQRGFGIWRNYRPMSVLLSCTGLLRSYVNAGPRLAG